MEGREVAARYFYFESSTVVKVSFGRVTAGRYSVPQRGCTQREQKAAHVSLRRASLYNHSAPAFEYLSSY